jgi:hypothetical protein
MSETRFSSREERRTSRQTAPVRERRVNQMRCASVGGRADDHRSWERKRSLVLLDNPGVAASRQGKKESARDVRGADLREEIVKRPPQGSQPSIRQRFTRSDEDGGDRRTSQRAERAIEYSARARATPQSNCAARAPGMPCSISRA